jgi:hypothetical protein
MASSGCSLVEVYTEAAGGAVLCRIELIRDHV